METSTLAGTALPNAYYALIQRARIAARASAAADVLAVAAKRDGAVSGANAEDRGTLELPAA